MGKFRYLVYSIAVAFVGYGIWIYNNDGQQIRNAVASIGFVGLLFLCSLSLFNYFSRYIRWRFFLQTFEDKPTFLDGLLCYCAGFALSTTPGKAGEAVRCLYFRDRHGVDHAHSFAALLADRVTDLLAAILISVAALYYFESFRWISLAAPAVVLLVLLAVFFPRPLLYCSRVAERLAPGILKPFFAAAPLFFQRAGTLFAPNVLTTGVVLGVVSWSAEAWGFAWLAQQLGCTGNTAILMGVFCLAMIAGATLPGGLGGTEAAMAVLLIALGMGQTEAMVVTVLCRLATLWLSIMVGLCATLWLAQYPVQPVKPRENKNT